MTSKVHSTCCPYQTCSLPAVQQIRIRMNQNCIQNATCLTLTPNPVGMTSRQGLTVSL